MSISNLIFTGCVACKNQVRNRQKMELKNQFRERKIFKYQVQIDMGIDILTQGNQAMPVKTNQPVLPVQCSDLGGRGGIDMALITAILAGF